MKYKVGDKVRVRKDLSATGVRYYMEDSKEGTSVNPDMVDKRGELVTIKRIEDRMYRIEEDDWWWTDEMFEGRVGDIDAPIDCDIDARVHEIERKLDKLRREIRKVIYNPPATIVFFCDGDKIVSKAEDEFDWETGLAICVLKKRMDKKTYNRLQPYFFEGETPLWDTLVRMHCPHGEWEKIKKEWKR